MKHVYTTIPVQIILLILLTFLFTGSTTTGKVELTMADPSDLNDRFSECGEPLVDIDDNDYRTVKIGNQCWMSENLRVTRYRDGSDIQTGLTNSQWENSIIGAYAIYQYDIHPLSEKIEWVGSREEMVKYFGKLYNWYAVDDNRGLCPEGWRVPSDRDWTELIEYLGDSAGRKMKSVVRQYWLTPNLPGSNESGFSGIPGGLRFSDGTYFLLGRQGSWWSSSEIDRHHAWNRFLFTNGNDVSSGSFNKRFGFSVRCLQE